MSLRPLLVALSLVSMAAQAQTAPPTEVDSVGLRQQAVELGLLSRVVVADDPSPGRTMAERMAHFRVPGVSVAVMRGGAVEWAQGYGVRRAGAPEAVTTSTLFQTASVSKPVTAAAVLRLAERGRVALDADINDALASWTLPANRFTEAAPVTLRHILTHTAGLTLSGFPGYAPGEPRPTAVGVLGGRGHTGPLRADTVAGAISRYSGGGYVLAQVLIQDTEGLPFATVMDREVLRPLQMVRSTYAQPLPQRLEDDVAHGHHGNGATVAGGWHVYPEQAPAGLWSTATDLARFALGVRDAAQGRPGAFLQRATAQDMLTPDAWGMGLGFQVNVLEADTLFLHTGSNQGYKAILVMYAGSGNGVAVLTNGDRGGDLMMEIVRAVSAVYGWPNFTPRQAVVVPLDETGADRFVGAYEFVDDPGYIAHVVREGGALYVDWPDAGRMRLLPMSASAFFVEGDGTAMAFEPDGQAGTLVWDGDEHARRVD